MIPLRGFRRVTPLRGFRSVTPLLEAEDLRKHFGGAHPVLAVDGLRLALEEGERFGLLGESGSGKSTVGRMLMGLLTPDGGRVCFRGSDIRSLSGERRLRWRREVQMVLQDPTAALKARWSVGESVAEPLVIHGMDGRRARQLAVTMLEEVGLPAELAGHLPLSLSGGQRQRVALARALALRPRFLVLDEPLSALDVSVQAQVANLLLEISRRFELGFLLIAHGLPMVAYLCQRVGIMQQGRLVETGPTKQVFASPLHPYTRLLLQTYRPREETRRIAPLREGKGETTGCRFYGGCPMHQPRCRGQRPALLETTAGHFVACHYPEEGEP